MRRVGGVLMLTLAVSGGALAAQPGLLPGRYHVGELGVLSLSITSYGNRTLVKGLYVKGTRCAFTDTDQLLEAEIEGSALVGKLTTCMEGSGCASPGVIPFMGVVNDGVVTAYISLPKGCTAPGLDERLLRISPTLESLKASALEATQNSEWARAQLLLRRATDSVEGRDDPRVMALLGSAYNAGRQYAEGRQTLQRALQLAPGRMTNEEKADLLYNLACSEANVNPKDGAAAARAIDFLKQALQLGRRSQLLKLMEDDPDLDPLRDLPDFQRVVGAKKANR